MKPRKYKNVPTEVDGIRFDSKREARRYSELKLLERAGEITELALQPVFKLNINGKGCGKYVADFAYMAGGKLHIEDSKGVKTQVYKLKKRIVEALYPIRIEEV